MVLSWCQAVQWLQSPGPAVHAFPEPVFLTQHLCPLIALPLPPLDQASPGACRPRAGTLSLSEELADRPAAPGVWSGTGEDS